MGKERNAMLTHAYKYIPSVMAETSDGTRFSFKISGRSAATLAKLTELSSLKGETVTATKSYIHRKTTITSASTQLLIHCLARVQSVVMNIGPIRNSHLHIIILFTFTCIAFSITESNKEYAVSMAEHCADTTMHAVLNSLQ